MDDDLMLEQEAGKLLVQIGRKVETWILDNAKQRVARQSTHASKGGEIDAEEIRRSLGEFIHQVSIVLEPLREGAVGSSRRAG